MVIALSIFLLCVLLAVGCSSPNTTPTLPTTTPLKTTTFSPATTTTTPSAPAQSTTVPVTSPTGPSTIAPPATKPATETTSSHLGGTLTWIEPNGPAGPIGASFLFASGNVCQQVCMETLLKEGNDGKLTEQLASLEYQNNPPTIIWHVKKGVKFSDGTEVNAQALKWNMQQQINSKLYASVSYYKSLDVIDD